MSFKDIIIEEKNAITYISLNRPEKLNALSSNLFKELEELLTAKIQDLGNTRGILLFGQGERAFAAGADIKEMSLMDQEEALIFSALAQKVTLLLEKIPCPVIACVDGFALGGGCELAMACDFIYATEKSNFGQPEVSLGLIPAFGGCIRFVRALGLAKAKEYIYNGKNISATKALELKLINKKFKNRKDLFTAAEKELIDIFKNSSAAIAKSKIVINNSINLSIEESLLIERNNFAQMFLHPEKDEGVAAFLEKRVANFS